MYPKYMTRGNGDKRIFIVRYGNVTFKCKTFARVVYLRSFLLTKKNIPLPH